MKLLRWFAAVGLAGAGICAGSAGRLTAADTSPPTRGAIVLHDCTIKAVKTVRLGMDRPGIIAFIGPKEGDTVKEDTQIVRLMDAVPAANWEVAKLVADDVIELEYATKANEVDGHEYIKSVAANRKAPGTISEIELERLKLQEQKSALQIRKAKHDIEINLKKADQAKAELDTYRILAPFDGFVSQVLKYKGDAVKQGDTILELVNTETVHVEGIVKDVDIWRVKKGAPVTVQLAIKGADLDIEKQVFRGKIGFVDDVANATETRVWAEVPNPSNLLRPGFFATMTISPDEGNAGAVNPRPAPVSSKIAGRRDFRAP